jgi:hypothetical protein
MSITRSAPEPSTRYNARVSPLSAASVLAPSLLLSTGLVVAACSSSGSPPADAGTPETGTPVAAAIGCPGAAPSQGGACGPQGIACEYGTAATLECNTLATCNGGRWEVVVPDMTKSACQNGPAADCPASFMAVPVGEHCDVYEVACDFPQGRCACTVRQSPTVTDASAQATWICPSPGSGCPLPRPDLGTACTGSAECDYGTCAIPGATAQTCTNGVWTEEGTACP